MSINAAHGGAGRKTVMLFTVMLFTEESSGNYFAERTFTGA